ncbi:hypothetical protein P4S72_04360 [Vibrio sp. PP-XX7]
MVYKEGVAGEIERTFTFYSLYQHLAPHCEPHVGISLGRRYVMTQSRNARDHAGLDGDHTTLEKGVVIEESDKAPQTKDGYEFRAFKMIENTGETKGIADAGKKSGLLAGVIRSCFLLLRRRVSPDWMVNGVIAQVATSVLNVRSDPDPKTKAIGPILEGAQAKLGTRIYYQKTQHYGWFELGGTKRLFARCKFINGDVKTRDGTRLEAGWMCIEPAYIQPLARKNARS